MRICLFEDRRVADLGPIALTRPAFELLCGLTQLDAKHRRYFAPDAVGYLVHPHLTELARERRPQCPVNDPLWVRSGPTVLVNARWVPPVRAADQPAPTTSALFAGGPFLAVCDGDVAFAALDGGLLAGLTPGSIDDCLDDWLTALPREEVGGFVLRRADDLVGRNPARIEAEFPALADPDTIGFHPAGLHVVGPETRLFVHPTASVDPLVVADTTGGPVVVMAGAVVRAFTRLEGTCAVGPGAELDGASIRAGTTVGPHCRVGGELEAAVLLGSVDKPHAGFLGNAVVGEWTSFGPGAQVGERRGSTPACAIGDHATFGSGVLVGGGSAVGAFGSVLPTGRLAPREVPAFARFGPDGWSEVPTDAALSAAEATMKRRGDGLSRAHDVAYRAAMAQTASVRRRVVFGGDDPRSRKAG